MADLALARTRITEATQRCMAAARLGARQAAFDDRIAGEWTPRRAALDGTDPAVASCVNRIDDALTKAKQRATARDHVGADAALDAALKEVDAATALKASSAAFKPKLAALKTEVAALTTASPRNTAPHIGPEIDALDATVARAEAGAAAFTIDAAQAELDAATKVCQRLKAKRAACDPASTVATVKGQMATLAQMPGGDEQLDLLVASLPATDDSRKHVLAAMEVRFRLKGGASDAGVGADAARIDELLRLYKLFGTVPDKHTKDNPSLAQVTRKPSGGSSYNPGLGRITMGDGPRALRRPRSLAKPTELPVVDEDCQPAPAAAPIFFDWNTQHEIAHALDDKKKFMATRAGAAEFGGWIDHGGNVLAVGEAAAAEFGLAGIDKSAIALYLDKGTEPAGPPDGWDRVKAWADKARVGASPWQLGADCASQAAAGGLRLGDRVFQESADRHWVSYAAAARSKGITGYQFRSRGEWFSELYAAYKLKVLKPSHPANAWLAPLFGAAAPTS